MNPFNHPKLSLFSSILLFNFLILFHSSSNAQSFDNSQLVSKIWTHTAGDPGDTLNWTNQVIDASRNLVQIGNNLTSTNTTDMLLTKYNHADGSIIWQVQYNNSGGDDYGISLVTDGTSKNIYTATASYVNSTNGYDWVIQKYDSTGTVQWTKTFNSGFYDVPTDLKYDGSGHLYVTGVRTQTTTLQDYCTIKYNSSNGSEMWSSPSFYDYANLVDIPAAITIGGTGRIIISGGSGSSLTNWDFATVKYAPSTGAQVSATRNASSGLGFDQVTSLAKDAADNIYITGRAAVTGNGYDIKVVKLDTELNTLWSLTWDGSHLDDAGNAIAVDANGYVYVTGYTKKTNGGVDMITLKYNGSGTLQWSKRFIAPDPTKSAIAKKLDIDPYGNILITGDAYNIGNRDIITLAYDISGNKKWEEWYSGFGNGDDYASGIKIDDASDYFYVTGKVWTGSSYSYLTTKYQMVNFITPPDDESCPSSFAYYENKGQIIDDTGAVRADLPFYCQSDNPLLYFSNKKVYFQFLRHDTSSATPDSIFRVDMSYFNGLTSSIYSAAPTVPGYLNYFLPQCPNGATIVRGNQYLLMKGIYTNVDALYHGNSNGLKMYFICYPSGSSTPSVVMKFSGASAVSIVSGKLGITTPLGNILFDTPTAYQIDNDGSKITLSWTPSFSSLGSGKIGFTLGTYDHSKPLIIQVQKGYSPTTDDCGGNCTWSTYYDGTFTSFQNIRTDVTGKIYVVGDNSKGNFSTTNGVVQQNPGGIDDAVVMKFNADGSRAWATYFGGSKDDSGWGVDVDGSGNVFFTGGTISTDFSLLVTDPGGGAYVQSSLGNSGTGDAFIAKINDLGNNKIWVTYYGGGGTERGFDLKLDANNDVYVVGSGDASTPVLNVSGAYNETNGKGFIAEFSTGGVRQWASNFGTSAASATVYAIDVDDDNQFFIVGTATGNGLPTAGTHSNLTYRGGSYDGFAAAFNTDRSISWCSYIGGDQYDQARDCAVKNNSSPESPDKLMVTGVTNSTETTFLPLSIYNFTEYHDYVHTGIENAFISQFEDVDDVCQWSTFYGTYVDVGQGIVNDIDDRTYVTGFTESDDIDLPAVDPDIFYFDDSKNIESDIFLICFDRYNNLVWGTYFGGDAGEKGYALATYQNHKLYMTGNTQSVSEFPLDDGNGIPYFLPTGNENIEGFIARFDLDISFIGVETISSMSEKVKVFPNPSNGFTQISLPYSNSEKCNIVLRNSLGAIVKDFGEFMSEGLEPLSIDASEIPKGLYLLEMIGTNSSFTVKLSIQ